LRFPFTLEAQARLRAIDRATALRILEVIARFGETGAGDVESMQGEWSGCHRLRVGGYRVIFRYIKDGLEILTVGHRSEVHK
jgi:mRNA-degrading endonuclease RelE of RelBE toxin-antitoxin system